MRKLIHVGGTLLIISAVASPVAMAQDDCYFGDGDCGTLQTDCDTVPRSKTGYNYHNFKVRGNDTQEVRGKVTFSKGQAGAESTASLTFDGDRCDGGETSNSGQQTVSMKCTGLAGTGKIELRQFSGTATSVSRVEACARGYDVRVSYTGSNN